MGWKRKIGVVSVVCLLSITLNTACSDNVNPAPASCLAGETRACVCEGNVSSYATCDPIFGVWGPCLCPEKLPDVTGDSASDMKRYQPTGPNFRVQLSSGGGHVASPNYRLNLRVGPAQPVGKTSSPNYRLHLTLQQ